MNNYKLVYISWWDHCSFEEARWREVPEVHELKPYVCHSVGYIIKEEEDHVVVAQTIAVSEEYEDKWVGEMLIMKPLIIEMKEL